jgi:ubiquinone/menaquinone biosynthesis C-methylase UbiE
MKSPRLYSDFAKYYDRLESQYRDYEKEAAWIRNVLDSKCVNRIVDISCGTGQHIRHLLNQNGYPGKQLVAMDASLNMVSLAKARLAPLYYVNIFAGDFLRIPFRSSSFDGAICMYWSLAGLNPSQTKELFQEVARIIIPSGILIFDVENAEGIKENLLGTPFIDAFFFDKETNSNVIRVNYSKKTEPDVVDWHSKYLIETDGVVELLNDEMKLRFYSRKTLESLLSEAGFRVLEVSSSPGGKYEPKSPSLYFVSEKL